LFNATIYANVEIGTTLSAFDQCGEIFIDSSQFDTTFGVQLHIYKSYSLSLSNSQFYNTGCDSGTWPKLGNTTAGIYIIDSTNCSISNCFVNWTSGSGLCLLNSNGTLSGCKFTMAGLGEDVNNSSAIVVSQSAPNDTSWVITGCHDSETKGLSIVAGANTEHLVVVGNYWGKGHYYGSTLDVTPVGNFG
jgi:parallel beta-helix repeat protein